MCALNNSLSAKLRNNEDTLTANYESAMTRAGLQQDFRMKVMQYRQFNGVIGDLPNRTWSRSSASETSCTTPRPWKTCARAPTRPP
jgi:hypothetical protein